MIFEIRPILKEKVRLSYKNIKGTNEKWWQIDNEKGAWYNSGEFIRVPLKPVGLGVVNPTNNIHTPRIRNGEAVEADNR